MRFPTGWAARKLNDEARALFFWAHVRVTDSGCWEWTGNRFKGHPGKPGYGRISVGKKVDRAHRVAYEMMVGPIPDGLMVCHHCDNPPCMNPSHLFVGTNQDNQNDAKAKGRDKPPYRGRTHCKHGHEFTPENTILKHGKRNGSTPWVGTTRICRTCHESRLATWSAHGKRYNREKRQKVA